MTTIKYDLSSGHGNNNWKVSSKSLEKSRRICGERTSVDIWLKLTKGHDSGKTNKA